MLLQVMIRGYADGFEAGRASLGDMVQAIDRSLSQGNRDVQLRYVIKTRIENQTNQR